MHLLLWGGINMKVHSELATADRGTMAADRNVFELQVVPFTPFIGDSIFMNDNSHKYSHVYMVNTYLQEAEIQPMLLLLHMNSSEHVWDMVIRKFLLLRVYEI